MWLMAVFLLASCAAAPDVRAPPAIDCVEIGVYSNGFHSSVIAPRETFAEDHQFRRLFPNARWFVAGWGDEAFFREPEGGTLGQGLRAAFPGGPTVVQVIALEDRAELYFASGESIYFAVSQTDAAALGQYFSEQIVLSADGSAVVAGPGHHSDRSYFLRGRDETFSLFNNCNHWAARALRAAGVDIAGTVTARALVARANTLRSRCSEVFSDTDRARASSTLPSHFAAL